MTLDQRLLDILACPKDKGPLYYIEAEAMLYNPRLRLRYEIRDDIPVMLVDEATELDDTEHGRVMAVVAATNLQLTFDPGQ